MKVFEHSMVEEFSKRFALKVNIKLLGLHILFTVLFLYFKVYVMVWTNIGSIVIYAVSFLFLKERRVLYLKITYLEIMLHMTLAILCIGWKFGFQLYSFALIPMIFYADYLEKKIEVSKKIKYHPYVISVTITIWFCLLRILASVKKPIYTFDNEILSIVVFIFNTIITSFYILYFMSLYREINQQSEEIIREGAQLDALTGLKNKSWLLQMEEAYFEEQQQLGNDMFIAVVDIDDFKHLNDTYGHQFGDKVLFQVAMKLKELENKEINVCRWGGEEFLLFGNGKIDFKETLSILNEVKEKVSKQKFYYQAEIINVTITIGITQKTTETNFDALMKKADEKLYFGKRNGKNQIVT